MPTAFSINLPDRSAASEVPLRRRGDLRKVLLGVLLLGVMAATHARADSVIPGMERYGTLLHEHVTSDGLVDYSALHANYKNSINALDAALFTAPHGNVAVAQGDTRLATLINVYNAAVLRVLLVHGAGTPQGTRSILSIDDGGVFDAPLVFMGDKTISLNQLEKEHIAPLAGDDRYHFAINCGAYSCPPLRAEAYTGEKLQRQLDDQRARTLDAGDPRFLVREGDGAVKVTKLFDWYADEFGDPAAYLNEHAGLPGEVTDVSFLEYDWSLNAQRPSK